MFYKKNINHNDNLIDCNKKLFEKISDFDKYIK